MTDTAKKDNSIKTASRAVSMRVTGLDMYRIIACMLVIINHCNSKVMFQVPPKSLAWFVTVGVFYITKIAVPGFLMIAGYNLLHRLDSWKKTRQRALRIFLVMVVFSLLYFAWRSADYGLYESWKTIPGGIVWNFAKGFVGSLFHNQITDAFWYLYMYLGIMIVLPFLQKLAHAMSKEDFYVLFGIAFIFTCVIPTVAEFVPFFAFTSYFELPIVRSFGGSVVYMFIGHYYYAYVMNSAEETGGFIEKTSRDKENYIKTPIWALVCGFVLGFVLNMTISMIEFGATGGESFLNVGEIEYLPLFIESLSMFTLLLKIRYSEWMMKLIGFIAPCTFGIYLFSDFICSQTHMIYYYLCIYMNRLFAVAIQDIVALIIAFGVVWLLRKIPVLRKYI